MRMTDIREVLAANLKKHRRARGWSQAKLAEKAGTSTQYVGALEIKGNFPSSDMVHRLAAALGIDPTELFRKDMGPEAAAAGARKAAVEDIEAALGRLLAGFFSGKMRELEDQTEKR